MKLTIGKILLLIFSLLYLSACSMSASIVDLTQSFIEPDITIVRKAGQLNPTNALPIEFTVSFSSEIDPNSITASNFVQTGTATGVTWTLISLGDNKNFLLQATTLTSSGTVIPELKSDQVKDKSGNAFSVSASTNDANENVDYDIIRPNVTINQTTAQADPTGSKPVEFDVIFDEEVKASSFTASDIVQSGTATGVVWTVTPVGDRRRFILKATQILANGTVVPTLAANLVSDLAGNFNNVSTSTDNSVTFDSQSPSLTIEQKSGQSDPTNSFPIEYTVTFSKTMDAATFTIADITQTGTATGVVWSIINSGDDTIFTIRALNTTSNGTIIPKVSENLVADTVGNLNAESFSVDSTVTYDNVAPTLTINQKPAQTDPTNVLPILFDVVFSEEINPATFTNADITQNGTATGVTWTVTNSGDNRNFVVAATVSGQGTLVPSIAANAIQDPAGNNNLVSTSTDASVTYDSSKPNLTINQKSGQADPTNTLPIEFDVVFSEEINPATFTTADITQIGTASIIAWNIVDSGDHINFVLQAITVGVSGTLVPQISGGLISDLSGNTNNVSTATDNSVRYDTTAPTLTINQKSGQSDPTNTLPIQFDVAFSEVINATTFTVADITQNGTATGITWNIIDIGDQQNFTLQATVSTEGTIIPSIAASRVADVAGNQNTSASTSTDSSVKYDITLPTLTINQKSGQVDPTNTLPIEFDLVVSEEINVSTLAIADITQNGTATGITWSITDSGDQKNFVLSATAITGIGTVQPSIALNLFQDLAGNNNTASSSSDHTVVYDNSGPTVTINQKSGQADPTNVLPIEYDVVFSEPIDPATFVISDITQSGTSTVTTWTITNSGDDTNFVIRATAVTNSGTVRPTLAAGVVKDISNNNNLASTATDNIVTYDITGPLAPLITGATGTGDATANNLLSSGSANSIATLNWNDVADEQDYLIRIFENDGTTEKCAQVTKSQNSTSHTFTGCSLTQGKAYKVELISRDALANPTNASNNMYAFLYAPEITINDPAAIAENDVAGKISFTISLNVASDWATTVAYATANNTALTAGMFNDYVAASGTANIAAGNTTATVDVNLIDGSYDEPDTQTFYVNLTSPTNSIITDTQGLGSINDNDNPPTISFASNQQAIEAQGPLVFTANLSLASEKAISVNWATTNGVGTSGVDFTGGTGGPVNYAAATITQNISIPIIDNTNVCQVDRDFSLTLNTLTNVTAGTVTATGLIKEDDFPTLNLSHASTTEGESALVNVNLTAVCPNQDITVSWSTSSGTAVENQDFAKQTGNFLIRKGEWGSPIRVSTIQDSLVELEENFLVQASGVSSGNPVYGSSANVTIQDNDSGAVSVMKIANGDSHTCALLSDGRVKCWGAKLNGRLGVSLNVGDQANQLGDNLPAINLGAGLTATQVSTASNSSCALLDNGKIKCWGSASTSNLFTMNGANKGLYANEMGDLLGYISLGSVPSATDVKVGSDFACARFSNQKIKCWGNNGSGQLGVGDTVDRGSASTTSGDYIPYVNLGTGRTVQKFAVGLNHSCAILDNNQVKCWGLNVNGQLGYGDTATRGSSSAHMGDNLPYVDLGTGKTATQINVGDRYSCAFLNDNTIKCWGFNDGGQLGLGDVNSRGDAANEMGDNLPAVSIGESLTGARLISGYNASCVILSDGRAKCWGLNDLTNNKLGLGTGVYTQGSGANQMGANLPFMDFGVSRTVLDASLYQTHSCFLLDGNELRCIGNGTFGRLGSGSTTSGVDESVATSFNPGASRTVVKLSNNNIGSSHTCVILDNGALKCFGYNQGGQLGQENGAIGDQPGEMGSQLQAVDLGTNVKVIDIAAGDSYTCVLTSAQQVKCWGYNELYYGRLGLGDSSNRGDDPNEMGNNLPYLNFGAGRTVKSLRLAEQHGCVILDNDQVKCWGRNANGILGIGSTASRGDSPAHMGDALPYIDLGAGRTAKILEVGMKGACAILDNNQTKCWGTNSYGRFALGIAAATYGDVSTEMGDNLVASNFGTEGSLALVPKMISMHSNHACYLFTNDKMKCWGANDVGQLGQGNTTTNIGATAGTVGNNASYVSLGTNLTPLKVVGGGSDNYDDSGYTCTLFTNQKIKCWGGHSSYSGPTGNATVSVFGNAANEMGDNLPFVNLGQNLLVRDVFAKYANTCAVLTNGQVKCFGNNLYGQLGIGTRTEMGNSMSTIGDNLPYVDLSEAAPALSTFAISGVTGGSDVSVDSILAHTEATIEWGTSTGATNYLVTIFENDKTTIKCAEQSTAATTYSFTGCTLTDDTVYFARVIASNGANQLTANNSLYAFKVDQTQPSSFNILGVNSVLDTTIDNLLTDGLNARVHWQKSNGAFYYSVEIKDAGGGSTICSSVQVDSSQLNYNFANCDLVDGTSYQAHVSAYDAAGNFIIAANSPFAFSVSEGNQPLAFTVSGITGGSDTSADTQLTNGSWATVNWSDSQGENYYSVSILENDGVTVKCSAVSVPKDTTSYSFTSCDLTDGVSYKAKVRAIDTFGVVEATNSPFDFSLSTLSSLSFSILGIQGTSIDTTNDAILSNGNIAKVVWSASTGADSYNVTILDSSTSSVVCATQNTTNTEYTFGTCYLQSSRSYRATVVAVKGAVNLAASNSPFEFALADYPLATISNPSAIEGNNLVFNVALDKVWAQNVVLKWMVSTHEAIPGSDLNRSEGSVTITPGNQSGTIQLTTIDDTLPELDEKLIVSLYEPTNAKLSRASIGIGTIQDNDAGVGIASIRAGANSSCKLETNGEVKCWGAKIRGELGIPTDHIGDEPNEMGDQLPIIGLPAGATPSKIATAGATTCIIRTDLQVSCWGGNVNWALGIAPPNGAYGDEPTESGSNMPTIDTTSFAPVEISGGSNAFCIRNAAGAVRCWGEGSSGMLGRGNTNASYYSAIDVDLGTGVTAKKVSVGLNHVCVITNDDRVKCWGGNLYGKLGLGDTSSRGDGANEMGNNLPYVDLGTGLKAKDIILGSGTTCAILDNNLVKCWGRNEFGQLAVGDTSHKGDAANEMGDFLPTINFGALSTVKKISYGANHGCAILDNDLVKCWGRGFFGQIGTPDSYNIGSSAATLGDNMPYVDLGTGLTASDLFLSANNSCFKITSTNNWKCIGYGYYGFLGTESRENIGDSAYELGDYLNYLNVGTGRKVATFPTNTMDTNTVCGILDNNTVKCWGLTNQISASVTFYTAASNGKTYIGASPGDTQNKLKKIDFGTGRTVKQFEYADGTGCAVLDNGDLKCFGNFASADYNLGTVGQLMTDLFSTTGDNLPLLLSQVSYRNILKVSMGSKHICVLFDTFEMKCSGISSRMGLEGFFTNSNSDYFWSSPISINFGTDRYPINMAVSGLNTCAVLDNFEMKCFGAGTYGVNGLMSGSSSTLGNAANSMGDNLGNVNLGTGKKVYEVEPGYESLCAHLSDQTIRCWGRNIYGQNGNGLASDTNIGDAANEMGASLTAINFGGATPLRLVPGLGYHYHCALVNNGGTKETRCWGYNTSGQIGTGGTGSVSNGLSTISLNGTPHSIYVGYAHACSLLESGSMKCWGLNASGQLGLGDLNNRGDGANEMGANLPAIAF